MQAETQQKTKSVTCSVSALNDAATRPAASSRRRGHVASGSARLAPPGCGTVISARQASPPRLGPPGPCCGRHGVCSCGNCPAAGPPVRRAPPAPLRRPRWHSDAHVQRPAIGRLCRVCGHGARHEAGELVPNRRSGEAGRACQSRDATLPGAVSSSSSSSSSSSWPWSFAPAGESSPPSELAALDASAIAASHCVSAPAASRREPSRPNGPDPPPPLHVRDCPHRGQGNHHHHGGDASDGCF